VAITAEYDGCYLGYISGTVTDFLKSLTLRWTCQSTIVVGKSYCQLQADKLEFTICNCIPTQTHCALYTGPINENYLPHGEGRLYIDGHDIRGRLMKGVFLDGGYTSGPFGVLTGGVHLSDVGQTNNGPITAIRVRGDDVLDGVNFYYGSGKNAGNYFGNKGGYQHMIDLDEGEHIKSVTVYHGRCCSNHFYGNIISRFEFTTSAGRSFAYGKREGTVEAITAKYDGCYLGYISGTVSGFIQSLTYHWKCEGTVHLSDVDESKNGPITAIRVRSGDILDGLNFYYGNDKNAGNYFGNDGGDQHLINLKEGEHIKDFTLYHGVCCSNHFYGNIISRFVITTSAGRTFAYGKREGTIKAISAEDEGCYIEYISGNVGRFIQSLTPHWKCEDICEENLTSAQLGGTGNPAEIAWTDIENSENGIINGMIISTGLWYGTDIIKSIQFQYGAVWGSLHGVENSQTLQYIPLQEGKKIIKVSGEGGWMVDNIVFESDDFSFGPYGGAGGDNTFVTQPCCLSGNMAYLKYISGGENIDPENAGIVYLQFHWECD